MFHKYYRNYNNVLQGDTFVITGDIPTMWHRDSTFQVGHYLPFINEYTEIKKLFVGLINRQLIIF